MSVRHVHNKTRWRQNALLILVVLIVAIAKASSAEPYVTAMPYAVEQEARALHAQIMLAKRGEAAQTEQCWGVRSARGDAAGILCFDAKVRPLARHRTALIVKLGDLLKSHQALGKLIEELERKGPQGLATTPASRP